MTQDASFSEKPELLDRRELAAIRRAPDPEQRGAIACAIITCRQPDRLQVGEPAPAALELAHLDGSGTADLEGHSLEPPRIAMFYETVPLRGLDLTSAPRPVMDERVRERT